MSEPAYERPLDAAETAVYDELRALGCIVAVEPADADDCAFVAVHAVHALRRAGLMGAGRIADANECPACDAYGICPSHKAIHQRAQAEQGWIEHVSGEVTHRSPRLGGGRIGYGRPV